MTHIAYDQGDEDSIRRAASTIPDPIDHVIHNAAIRGDTGGLATLFDRHTDLFDAIEGDLTIQGLAMLYTRSQKRA